MCNPVTNWKAVEIPKIISLFTKTGLFLNTKTPKNPVPKNSLGWVLCDISSFLSLGWPKNAKNIFHKTLGYIHNTCHTTHKAQSAQPTNNNVQHIVRNSATTFWQHFCTWNSPNISRILPWLAPCGSLVHAVIRPKNFCASGRCRRNRSFGGLLFIFASRHVM